MSVFENDPAYAPIGTVPRDGRPVYVAHDEVGVHAMVWDDEDDCWRSLDGNYVWQEAPGLGPSHWRPYGWRSLN